MFYQSNHSGGGYDHYGLKSVSYRRNTPLTVFAPLDTPEASAFIRMNPITYRNRYQNRQDRFAPRKQKKNLEKMLEASDKYVATYLGPDFPGMNTEITPITMQTFEQQTAAMDARDDLVNKVKASPLNPNDRSRKRHKFKVKVQKNLKKIRSGIKATPKMEGTYMGTFDKKAVDKYMSKKKKAPKPASDEYKRKLAKAYGIKQETKDGITKKEKYMMTGRHLYDPKQGLQLEAPQDKGLSGSNRSKMDQLFRMGLIAKDERQLFLRALKRGSAALKDPLLRNKLYELLRSMMKIVTDDQQIYRQFRQYVQMNKRKGSGKGAFDVQEALDELNREL